MDNACFELRMVGFVDRGMISLLQTVTVGFFSPSSFTWFLTVSNQKISSRNIHFGPNSTGPGRRNSSF